MEEFRRSPVDMENLPLFTGFYVSQVVQDFFHQQYNMEQTTFPRFVRTIRSNLFVGSDLAVVMDEEAHLFHHIIGTSLFELLK